MKFRHGDVLIEKIGKLPKEAKKIKGNVLAKGEVTGHSHRLIAKPKTLQLFQTDTGIVFETTEPTKLIHQEHEEIEIPKGIFRTTIQREYSPMGNRKVMD